MKKKLRGNVITWTLAGRTRRLAEISLPFKEARELFVPAPYDALKNEGEQRDVKMSHVRKLKRAMEAGEFTPTPGAVGLREQHVKAVKYQTLRNKTTVFDLEVDSKQPLPLTDGGHRMESLNQLLLEANELLAQSKDKQEKLNYEARVNEILALPFCCTLYLDGDTRQDFINLQSGRSLDSSHLFSLQMEQKSFDNPAFRTAYKVAQELHNRTDSPFKNIIRFDSAGLNPLPIKTLCSDGASDLATSLIGLAKVGGDKPDELATSVIEIFKALQKEATGLLDSRKVLTPLGNGGTKGSATMLIGLAVCFTHRVALSPDKERSTFMEELLLTAMETLDREMRGGFSGPRKRELMGAFAKRFFESVQTPKHEGLPVTLLKTLSSSTFCVTRLPREKKPKLNVVEVEHNSKVDNQVSPSETSTAA